MSSSAINWTGPLHITDHAYWRAAERFPGFDTVAIEQEVRSALSCGRLSPERAHLGLSPHPDPASLYVWTEDGQRIYALKAAGEAFFVITVMDRGDR